ncbi:flagella synthesis protein FlgN [Nitrosomonas sp. PY1]|uniref:flagella synthesis protein FlgN n=1 Tax=Nitrosomonas sp. PY1 TaxID=1803906 RepID=UPI001FC8CE92|nr:flagellar protein FlgN [Nitrosomonas sp. PY1]GKS70451.1 flagella synthesis protein FlgN [Nitrosomonas sp. PY1]
MASDMSLAELASCLKIEKKLFEELIEILKQEENALTQSHFNKLDDFVSKKTSLLEQLSQLDFKRNQYFKNNGVALEKKAINYWLETHSSNNSEILSLWNQLLALVDTTKNLNHTNGLIISKYLQHNQRTFVALQCASGNISLYGPNGQAYI